MSKIGRVFTDGACSGNPGGPGGWAAVFSIGKKDGEKILKGGEKETTNNRMELIAVIKAVEKICKSKRIKHFEIYSDSAYVVNAINMHWIVSWKLSKWKTSRGGDVKNSDLWKRLDDGLQKAKCNGIEIVMVKVKGHSGNPLNEYADSIAKEQVQIQKQKGK